MSLEKRAVLEIDSGMGDAGTGVFELREALDVTEEVSRDLLMGPRGQYLTAVFDIGTGFVPKQVAKLDPQRRMGYSMDEGMGADRITLSAEVSITETQHWGDGSSPTGDYNAFDAPDAPPTTALQVFKHYLAQTNTDSRGQARLHHGEWTDGSYSDEAGVFGEPLLVSVDGATFENEHDHPGVFSVTLELTRTQEFPLTLPDVDDGVEEVEELIDGTANEISKQVPDF